MFVWSLETMLRNLYVSGDLPGCTVHTCTVFGSAWQFVSGNLLEVLSNC